MAVQYTKLSVSPEVVQSTGTSETVVMSQNAVTTALNDLDTRVTTLEDNGGGGGSSGGGSTFVPIDVTITQNGDYTEPTATAPVIFNQFPYHKGFSITPSASNQAMIISNLYDNDAFLDKKITLSVKYRSSYGWNRWVIPLSVVTRRSSVGTELYLSGISFDEGFHIKLHKTYSSTSTLNMFYVQHFSTNNGNYQYVIEGLYIS